MNKKLKKELDHYLTHPNQYVLKTAQRVLDMAHHLESGAISQSEFDELVGDVLDIAHISKAADDVQTAARIETAVRAMIALLPKLVGIATGK